MAKIKFEQECAKILNQGVIFERSFVYKIDVNRKGMFAISKWPYYRGACHGRKPIAEWVYSTADEALAKFDELKKLPHAEWDSRERLYYVD